MNPPLSIDSPQAALWNGAAGHAWVQAQPLLDRMFAPFEALLAEAADAPGAGPGMQVLDIGCGTGATTLAIARRLGDQGRCTGIDLSAPMVAAARQRGLREGLTAPRADFVCADAQTHAFAPASVDRLVSRFGVMFFGDPVAAFANLRRAARPGASLCAIAWRSAAENPFMTAAERAAAPLLPGLPVRQPDAPGQFAFADRERVADILQASGWAGVEIEPLDAVCSLRRDELVPYFTGLGPVGLALRSADGPTRTRVIAAVRAAFEPFVQGEAVRFGAACWRIAAQAAAGGTQGWR